ncbi:MAG: hypothetical protein DLM52_04845 [Chthoniobacterales bacterium]|nr:MAG: hypothetical protein DLM52_04845 [Chthoniobacterales bacterium]
MSWFFWAILSALFAGVTAILAKVGVEGVDSNLATAIRTTVILLFTWSLFFLAAPSAGIAQLGARNWLFLVLSGFATGLSWVCYFRALQIGPASQVAPIDKLSVLFTIVLAIVFLRERLSWSQWLGSSLICAGAIILALR